jgi:aspartyl-tRNA(Asn)/glutamyl-tRNA(Gln) amidotransferase subunit A
MVLMSTHELHDLTLAQASEAIGRRELSSVEYTDALIARSEALQPQLNTFITTTFESARQSAKSADVEIANGRYRGPLHGVPFALKDIYDTAGILTSGHSRTCIDRVPERDATCVARLHEAGAILTGKLATHEFAHGGPSFDLPWPPARNPWNTAHFTGGSSSGSAAATAAGLAPITLGSDTGGSIRGPAGLCGVAGMKPTYGLVSRVGVLPNSFTYDHCGPLARTAEDCALILSAIAGHDAADPASSPGPVEDLTGGIAAGIKGLRIGVIRHFWESDQRSHPALGPAMERAIEVFESLGASTENLTMRPMQHYLDVKIVTAESELFSIHLNELKARPEAFGQDFRGRALAACLFTAEDYVRASRCRRIITAEMDDVYDRYDLLLTANTSAAPRIDRHNILSFWTSASLTTPFDVTGGPALALPCGFTDDGLPLSLQLVGRPFDDALVLRAGHAFERETGYWTARPDLVPGETPAEIDPQAWIPDTSQVTAAVREHAENAAGFAGLRLPPEIMEELVAVAPHALAMAGRLPRDHGQDDEVSSVFMPVGRTT